MTLPHAPEGTDSNDEPSPDSGNLRVSPRTALESGIPPARDRLTRGSDSNAAIEQLELVLVESTRAEANLGLLLRGLKHLSAGASAAQEANAVLMQELEALRGPPRQSLRERELVEAARAIARERDRCLAARA